jgi:hypothetical protein
MQLENGDVIAVADWIDDHLFSTVQLVNGQTGSVEGFSASRSQQIPGGTRVSTRVDTNLPRAGANGLQLAWEMYIYSLNVFIVRAMRGTTAAPTVCQLVDAGGSLSDPPTLRTLFQVDRVTALAFSYNGKEYTQGVIQNYPQGHGYSAFSTQGQFEFAQNGVPSPRDRNALVLPIHMTEMVAYTLTYQPEAALVINQLASDGTTALTFVDVKSEIRGLIRRSTS